MSTLPPVVLVTGASRGLGRGIAIHCAQLGYSVAINYAGNRAAAEETAAACWRVAVQESQVFLPLQADISNSEQRRTLVDSVFTEFHRLDALVNNAGIAPKVRADITEVTEESFSEVLRTNLQGSFFLTQLVAKRWLSDKSPSLLPHGYKIIFISSVSAESVSVNRGEYCVSKAGLSMAAKLWAARLSAEGIQVYELRPGIMLSDMTSAAKAKYDALLETGLVPQRRWGTPEDVALAVGSLLSGHFPFSSGSVITIDGGLHLHQF